MLLWLMNMGFAGGAGAPEAAATDYIITWLRHARR